MNRRIKFLMYKIKFLFRLLSFVDKKLGINFLNKIFVMFKKILIFIIFLFLITDTFSKQPKKMSGERVSFDLLTFFFS